MRRLLLDQQPDQPDPVSLSLPTATDDPTPFGYLDCSLDPHTLLAYNQARHYDPTPGRWLAQDPIAFVGGDSDLYPYPGSDNKQPE